MPQKVTLKIRTRELTLSNLDQVLFPANGFRKGELIDYYIRVSKFILPHLKNRPLTLKMYHHGAEGAAVYERDAPPFTPPWVKTAAVWRKSGESQVRYILVNDLATLVWAANLKNIEMHVFLAKAPRIEKPTMVVFDLDPGPPAGLLDCAQVALWLKDPMDALHLQVFIKSSGAKGLHAYVPLNTSTTYEQTQAFARAVAEWLAEKHPNLVVSEMDKLAREGKVFVDWSQNLSYKSTVSVYSLRATQTGPTVSLPVSWNMVKSALDQGDSSCFLLEPAIALEKMQTTGDLFAPLLEIRQKLPLALAPGLHKLQRKKSPRRVPHLEAA